MPLHTRPAFAAWHHRDARAGFEVVFLHTEGQGLRVEGATTAVEDGEAWAVQYSMTLTSGWTTRSARVVSRSAGGVSELGVEGDGDGRWRIEGEHVRELDGCHDVDLEASAFTNALPVHRLGLAIGEQAEAPAVYVRAPALGVERLEQRYLRLDDGERGRRYHYTAPRFDFECELSYDSDGFVLDYPGIAVRAA